MLTTDEALEGRQLGLALMTALLSGKVSGLSSSFLVLGMGLRVIKSRMAGQT